MTSQIWLIFGFGVTGSFPCVELGSKLRSQQVRMCARCMQQSCEQSCMCVFEWQVCEGGCEDIG